jgi:hypothetical protein
LNRLRQNYLFIYYWTDGIGRMLSFLLTWIIAVWSIALSITDYWADIVGIIPFIVLLIGNRLSPSWNATREQWQTFISD